MPWQSRLERLEVRILEMLELKKAVKYSDLIKPFKLSASTANRYAIEISHKYDENIEYIDGWLRLKKPFIVKELPAEKRLAALQRHVQTQATVIEKERKLRRKIRNNHMSEMEKMLLKKDLDGLHALRERILRELEDGETEP